MLRTISATLFTLILAVSVYAQLTVSDGLGERPTFPIREPLTIAVIPAVNCGGQGTSTNLHDIAVSWPEDICGQPNRGKSSRRALGNFCASNTGLPLAHMPASTSVEPYRGSPCTETVPTGLEAPRPRPFYGRVRRYGDGTDGVYSVTSSICSMAPGTVLVEALFPRPHTGIPVAITIHSTSGCC